MTVKIVYALEMIYIQYQDRQRDTRRLRLFQQVVGIRKEESTVVESGQRVCGSLSFQFFLRGANILQQFDAMRNDECQRQRLEPTANAHSMTAHIAERDQAFVGEHGDTVANHKCAVAEQEVFRQRVAFAVERYTDC